MKKLKKKIETIILWLYQTHFFFLSNEKKVKINTWSFSPSWSSISIFTNFMFQKKKKVEEEKRIEPKKNILVFFIFTHIKKYVFK